MMSRNWTLLFFIGLLQSNLAGTSLGLPRLFVHEGTTYEIIKTDARIIEIRVKETKNETLEPELDTPPSICQVFEKKNQLFIQSSAENIFATARHQTFSPDFISPNIIFPTVFKAFRARSGVLPSFS